MLKIRKFIISCCELKVKSDHRSKFSNLSNWKEEAWKNQGFNGIRTRDLRDTGAMLYQLSYEATHWERGQFIEFISSRWSRWSPDFFRLLLSSCLNWKIYCDDHSSLSSTTAVQIWIISYKLHIISLHGTRNMFCNDKTKTEPAQKLSDILIYPEQEPEL